MPEKLTVDEASETYQTAMANIAAPGPGICPVCWTCIRPDQAACDRCGARESSLDVFVPISYSEKGGQLAHSLWSYKNAQSERTRRYAYIRLAAILWRFLEDHEACVAAAGGVDRFDTVTVVPSSLEERDDTSKFRRMVEQIKPIARRVRRVLQTTGQESSHADDPSRYETAEDLTAERVLLLDDTWTTGAHAEAAAACLRGAGAAAVAAVVIGRHVRPDWAPDGVTAEDRLKQLRPFDWDTCAVHGGASGAG